MDRRGFAALALRSMAAAATGLIGWPAFAQVDPGDVRGADAPREGRDFTRVSPPLPTATGGGIDVIEFFWYGCPHCAAFEPVIDAWRQRQPPGVTMRRVPVAFREVPYVAHQQLFYALEALGRLPTLHAEVFRAIHHDHLRLDTPTQIADFAAAHGVDMAAFLQAYGSFAVQTKAAEARRLSQAYRIDGVPSIGVQGRYFTSGTLAGSPERSLAVADALIGTIRRGN